MLFIPSWPQCLNSSTEGFLSESDFNIAYSASNSEGVDVLKLFLAQYDNYYHDLKQ